MKKLLVIVVLLLPPAALAQDPADRWLGGGTLLRPSHAGSDTQTASQIPLVRYYGGAWFARTTHGIFESGLRLGIGSDVTLGAQLAFEPDNRREGSDGQDIAAPDLDAGASIGMHVEWNTRVGAVPLNLLGRFRRQFEPKEPQHFPLRGVQVDLRVAAPVLASERFRATAFVQTTWANERSMRTYYGHDTFEPEAGLLYTLLGLQGTYDVGRRWLLIGSVAGSRLHAEAAASPLVVRRSNYSAVLGLAYRF